ncbi:hypothetical protein [Bifidobacterium callimiconis]|uniref:Uncharacterized protein n=1 Tax=Bifidobacterium callimiconis TaxID=2306973 RepID=A0A430FBZ0_9BIFI|nr:hypothetical protein [Bifidobacterium callimiconis]MBT1177689.1 hypothetical protein [Bifidobacterium callimiconis]RSX50364.1 hypothetical protein D2E23_1687 [Bifidobacterium callimiconis]
MNVNKRLMEHNAIAVVIATLMVLFGCWPLRESLGNQWPVIGAVITAILAGGSAYWLAKGVDDDAAASVPGKSDESDAADKKTDSGKSGEKLPMYPVQGIGLYMLAVTLGYVGATFPMLKGYFTLDLITGVFTNFDPTMDPTSFGFLAIGFVAMVVGFFCMIGNISKINVTTNGRHNISNVFRWTIITCLGFGGAFYLFEPHNWEAYTLPWLLELFALTMVFSLTMRAGVDLFKIVAPTNPKLARNNLWCYALIAVWITVRPLLFQGFAMQGKHPWNAFLLQGLFSRNGLIVATLVLIVAIAWITNRVFGWWAVVRDRKAKLCCDLDNDDRFALHGALLLVALLGTIWVVNLTLRYPVMLRWFVPAVFVYVVASRIRMFMDGPTVAKNTRSGSSASTPDVTAAMMRNANGSNGSNGGSSGDKDKAPSARSTSMSAMFAYSAKSMTVVALFGSLLLICAFHGQFLMIAALLVFGVMVRKGYRDAQSSTDHVPWFWESVLLFIGFVAAASTYANGFTIPKIVFIASSLVMASVAVWMIQQDRVGQRTKVGLPAFNDLHTRAFTLAALKGAMALVFAIIVALGATGGLKPASFSDSTPDALVSNVAFADGAQNVTVHVDHPEQVKEAKALTDAGYLGTRDKAQPFDINNPTITVGKDNRHVAVWITYKDGTVTRADRWLDWSAVQVERYSRLQNLINLTTN